MKTLVTAILITVMSLAATAGDVKCRSVSNYFGTRVVLEEGDTPESYQPVVSDVLLVAGGRSYNCLGLKISRDGSATLYDLMFERIRDLSDLTLFIEIDDDEEIIEIRGGNSVDHNHPYTRDYRAAVAEL